MTMPLSISKLMPALLGLVLTVSGCGLDPFSAPTRATSTGTSNDPETGKPAFIVFITSNHPTADEELWMIRAQQEANHNRAVFRIMGAVSEAPEKLIESVNQAVVDGASAILLVSRDIAGLPKALADAESKGVVVVLIGQSLPAPEGASPFSAAVFASTESWAKRIVETTLEDVKKAGLPTNGTAFVLADKVADFSSEERVASLKAAAEAAGSRKVVVLPFDPTKPNSAKEAVLEAVKAYPDVTMALGDDGDALWGAGRARLEMHDKHPFFVGGFTDYRQSKTVGIADPSSCHVEGRSQELGALAVAIALGRIEKGKEAPSHKLNPDFVRGTSYIPPPEDIGKDIPVRKHAGTIHERFNPDPDKKTEKP